MMPFPEHDLALNQIEELQARIHELEEEIRIKDGLLERAVTKIDTQSKRIRELEAENAELNKELDGFALMQRIAKAKAIMTKSLEIQGGHAATNHFECDLRDALEALKGK